MNPNIISIINGLAPQTSFRISVKWCKAHGYTNVTKGDVIRFGQWFVDNCQNYNCQLVLQTNRGVRNSKTNSKNHRKYIKL